MDIFRFYQGYLGNRNNFFAPSYVKKSNKAVVMPKAKNCEAKIIYRIVTAKGGARKRRFVSSGENELITPETLAFHVKQRKNSSTPNPQKNKFSTAIQTGKDSPVLHEQYKKPRFSKQTCEMAIQNESLTSLHFPEVQAYIKPIFNTSSKPPLYH